MTAATTTSGAPSIRAPEKPPWRPKPQYVPLVVGTMGHRDLSHVAGEAGLERLKQSVRDVFGALQGKQRATPLVLLSSLADGADRLVARVALELRICLVVPLPMPESEYKTTFRDQESINDFDDLCNQAARVFVVEGGSSADAVAAYEKAGAYVARSCHVLVALWDGESSQEKPGGTAQAVRFMRQGVPAHLDPKRSLLESPAIGPVCHIRVPRSPEAARAEAEPIEWLDPAGTPRQPRFRRLTRPGSFLDRIRQSVTGNRRTVWEWTMSNPRSAFSKKRRLIGEFNAEVETHEARLREDVANSKSWLLPATELDRLQREDRPLSALVERYAIADALAIHFQKWLWRYLVLILVLAGAVGLLFQAHVRLRLIYPIQEPGGPSWYTRSRFHANLLDPFDQTSKNLVGLANYDLVYIVVVVAIFILYFFHIRRRDDQRKYQDYRALAEGLRVQIYWRLSGLTNSVADHYLRKQRSELDWIRGALRAGEILDETGLPPGDRGVACERLRLVRECWVKDQRKFFVGVPKEMPGPRPWPWQWLRAVDIARDYEGRARARLDERRALVASWLDFILLACVFFAYAIARAFAGPQHLVIIGLAVVVLVLALLGVYAKIRAFSAHAKQYARMGTFFQNADHYLDKMLADDACDLAAARDLIRELGEEALVENGDWVLLHREKPVELPRT